MKSRRVLKLSLKLICSFTFAIVLWSHAPLAQAEYRVYQYYVKAKHFQGAEAQAHLVTSSLDPVSYLAYHGGSDAITVDLLRTWMCPGYTGQFKAPCEGPYTQLVKQETTPTQNQ